MLKIKRALIQEQERMKNPNPYKSIIFCPIITPKDIGGGIKSTISLMNGLIGEGYEVVVLVSKECDFVQKFNTKITIKYFNDNPDIALTKPLLYIRLCLFCKNIFRELPSGTLFFCSDRPALMLALFLSKNDKIIYVSRGWFYTNWSARFLRKFLFPKVKQFVGISDKQCGLMKLYANNEANVTLIQNGIKMPEKEAVIFKNDTITIATIGGICDRKNQMQCLELINVLRHDFAVRLNIFGTTFTAVDEEYKSRLEKYINDNQLQETVFFKGHESNIDSIYNNSDIVISTATEEGFGRTLIEAMSYGIPVIASSKAGGPSTIIENEVDGFLYDGTTDDLVKKIKLVIEDADTRAFIVANAIKKVQANYTEAVMSKNYSNLIENGI